MDTLPQTNIPNFVCNLPLVEIRCSIDAEMKPNRTDSVGRFVLSTLVEPPKLDMNEVGMNDIVTDRRQTHTQNTHRLTKQQNVQPA